MLCLCGRTNAPEPGDPVEIGVTLGNGTEPDIRWARLVGIDKHEEGIRKYVVREFRPGDTWYPTGAYTTTWLLVPWYHDHPTQTLKEG